MNPAYLANKLAEALDQIVPEPFHVREHEGMVLIHGGRYRAASEVADIIDQPGDDGEHAEEASGVALSMIQDYIAEHLTVPWPATGQELPSPKIDVTSEDIKLWFEDSEGHRVLEAPTIKW